MIHSESASISQSLLDQVRRKDELGWRRLSHLFAPSVYRWCRQQGLQASDAADVVQEVFLAVSKNIDRFRRDRPTDSFRGWLWTIFRSKLMDHFRRQKAQAPQGVPAHWEQIPEVEPSTGLGVDEDAARIVRRALKVIQRDFGEKTWQAFWRSAVLGERTSDVAKAMEISAPAVCMCRARVLARLRETLAGLDVLRDP